MIDMAERLPHYVEEDAAVDVAAEALRAIHDALHEERPTSVLGLLLNRREQESAKQSQWGVRVPISQQVEFEGVTSPAAAGLTGNSVSAVERVLDELVAADLAVVFERNDLTVYAATAANVNVESLADSDTSR